MELNQKKHRAAWLIFLKIWEMLRQHAGSHHLVEILWILPWSAGATIRNFSGSRQAGNFLAANRAPEMIEDIAPSHSPRRQRCSAKSLRIYCRELRHCANPVIVVDLRTHSQQTCQALRLARFAVAVVVVLFAGIVVFTCTGPAISASRKPVISSLISDSAVSACGCA